MLHHRGFFLVILQAMRVTFPMTSRSSGTQRLEIIVLVLPRPVRELGKELMSIQSGVALSIIQAPMVKGCVGVSKAILSPLPQPPPAC